MIEIIFTLDYEIYGNGCGSLENLVLSPAQKLKETFIEQEARFVVFVEVAELEMIELCGSDDAIGLVRAQVGKLHRDRFELGLHIHPQWYRSSFKNGKWVMDYDEYNLSLLPRERVSEIVDRSVSHLRELTETDDFIPFSFRAGNWLFQPSQVLASVLAGQGIKVDSSVFKGGLQHHYGLDFRAALKNGYYWRFADDINIPDDRGVLLELPIYSEMVPTWELFTAKRIGLQKQSMSYNRSGISRWDRLRDAVRFRYPKKFDFCRMSANEMISLVEKEIEKDRKFPGKLRPLVAIGHTKDLFDTKSIGNFLSYLRDKKIPISCFKDIYDKCLDARKG